MVASSCWSCAVALATAFLGAVVSAAEIKRLDGIHRLEKKAQITDRPVLHRRQEGTCGTGSSACPASLNGGCCPDGYGCASESCFATTRAPSTCHSRVGYYACAAVYGGGCCPDGYICGRADNCFPPEGSANTLACPTGRFLCPASLSYGCCPDGMGCAVNQCYSTEPSTMVRTMVITTTEDGETSTYTTTRTTVSTPNEPTAFPTVVAGNEEDQQVFKFFPSSIPKASAVPDDDGGQDGGGGLTTAQLAGIVAGAVAFLIIVIIAAYLLIRRLNSVLAQVNPTRKPDSAPPTEETRPMGSEMESISVEPLMVQSSRPGRGRRQSSSFNARLDSDTPDFSSRGPTPSSFGGGYHALGAGSPRQNSFDMSGNLLGYFDLRRSGTMPVRTPSLGGRPSVDSQGAYTHVRQTSDTSEALSDPTSTDGLVSSRLAGSPGELEGSPTYPYVSELASPVDLVVVSPMSTTSQPINYQGMWNNGSSSRGGRMEMNSGAATSNLVSVAEETTASHTPHHTVPNAGSRLQRPTGDEAMVILEESPIEYAEPSFER
ncbi:hypothetical protein S40288_03961 [Stachybotrys chartarum IBT 40288]|nr:hypothetical protein S40288_03961 [Stachybotrys chartarum IBT 40288]